jgi:hypothetical protein
MTSPSSFIAFSASCSNLIVFTLRLSAALRRASIIGKFRFFQGFEEIALKPVILSPLEFLRSENFDREFLSLINEGIVLWEEMSNETGIPGVPK